MGILIASVLGLVVMTRFFGLVGIFAYTLMAIVISNIQVLKATTFSFMSEPVALGTIVFSTTFLATDIVTEYYSREKAMKIVWLGFVSMVLMAIIMVLTIGIAPVDSNLLNSDHKRFLEAHKAMEVLFLPAPAIFLASLISYLVSQLNDVYLFSFLKEVTHTKYLWLRSGGSTALSSLLDSIVFSTLAWIIFADAPIDLKTLIWTYVLGTYILRLVMVGVNIPIVYAAKYFMPKRELHV